MPVASEAERSRAERLFSPLTTSGELEILRMRLEAQGYEVVTAADGEEALARAAAHRPTLSFSTS